VAKRPQISSWLLAHHLGLAPRTFDNMVRGSVIQQDVGRGNHRVWTTAHVRRMEVTVRLADAIPPIERRNQGQIQRQRPLPRLFHDVLEGPPPIDKGWVIWQDGAVSYVETIEEVAEALIDGGGLVAPLDDLWPLDEPIGDDDGLTYIPPDGTFSHIDEELTP
jgi:hypothetical protein